MRACSAVAVAQLAVRQVRLPRRRGSQFDPKQQFVALQRARAAALLSRGRLVRR